MIPIGDDRLKNAPTPFLTWLIILINIAVFIYEINLGSEGLDAFVFRYGAVPAQISQGQHLYSLFTAMFLHGGWMHIIGNMLFLWVFGDNIEAALGRIGFIFYYLAGGLIASAAHVMADTASQVPMVGASGAISACLGSYIVMFPSSRVHTIIPLGFFFTTIRVSAWIFLGIWIVLQLASSLITTSAVDAATSGVAWWAHIGGFGFGLLIGLIFRARARRLVVIRD